MCMLCELGASYSQTLDPIDGGIGGLVAQKPVYTDWQAARQVADWNHDTTGVLDARKWGSSDLGTAATVSYGYERNPLNDGAGGVISGEAPPPLLQLDAADIAISEEAVALIEDVANINLRRISDNDGYVARGVDLMVRERDAGWGNAPPHYEDRPGADELQPIDVTFANGFNLRHAIHEFLHGLGLNHPGNYDLFDSDEVPITYAVRAHYYQDSRQYSIMSYFSENWTGADYDGQQGSGTLMLHDVMALQLLYGANERAFLGNTTYGFNSNTNRSVWEVTDNSDKMFGAIWDAGGVDLLDLSEYNSDQTIDLREGAYSSVGGMEDNLAIAYGAVIENVIGGYQDDTITGNRAGNVMRDAFGDDRFFGRGGADFMFGGNGDDFFDGGTGIDSMYGGAHNDTVSYRNETARWQIDLNVGRAQLVRTGQFEVVEQIENVWAGSGDDVVAGDAGVNILLGGLGDDMLMGRDGADLMNGEDGADTLRGGGQGDRMLGGVGSDSLFGDDGADAMLGGRGHDWFMGGNGRDQMYGGRGVDTVDYSDRGTGWNVDLRDERAQAITSGNGTEVSGDIAAPEIIADMENITGTEQADTLRGTDGVNVIHGLGGRDVISGRGGADVLYGNEGADLIGGGNGADTLHGGDGNDTLRGGSGTDRFFGGQGRDRLDLSLEGSAFSVDLQNGQAVTVGTVELLTSIEDVWGSNFGDTILGDDNANHLAGRGGADRIGGRAGDDSISGGNGNDSLTGGFGNDRITGGAGTDTMDGGRGVDLVDYSYSNAGWQIDLQAGTATRIGGGSEAITRFEQVIGAAGNDSILGTNGANLLRGEGGNDEIGGRNGSDTIEGGAGNDVLRGGRGDDLILGGRGVDDMYGGGGFDTVDYSGSGREWTINLENGTAESDNGIVESISNFEAAMGGRGHGTMFGNDRDNLFVGRGGNDFVYGRDGDDTLDGGNGWNWLYGEFGDDTIIGGDGQDHIFGGAGADTLRGGHGEDVFVWNSVVESRVDTGIDVLQATGDAAAFTRGLDRIDLSGINGNLMSSDPTITFGGTDAGMLELTDFATLTRIALHRDNDGQADMVILIADGAGVAAADYTAEDFIL